jgi:hypothetical protein
MKHPQIGFGLLGDSLNLAAMIRIEVFDRSRKTA